MATYTPILNLYMPDGTDDFGEFREEHNDNMVKIENAISGGGGGGGHTIVDPDGNSLPQEDELQFTGAVSVTDDNVNGRTVVNVSGGSNLILEAQIYSTEEKQVGVWTDGKPLYEITIPIGALPNNAIKTVPHNIANVDLIFVSDSFFQTGAGASSYLNFTNDTTAGQIEILVNKTNIEIWAGSDRSSWNGYATVRYTKTTDIAGSGGYQAYGFSPVIYSDVERVIGVWRDNKPLYAKVISLGGSVNINAYSWYAFGTLAEQINIVDAKGYNDVGSEMVLFLLGANCDTNNDLSFLNYRNSSITLTHIAIQYTKTTDVAGSGDYNTYGVPTVHYSTSEQVIGTWIDGKPLYEKTLSIGALPNATESAYPHNISDLKDIIELVGMAIDGNGNNVPIIFANPLSAVSQITVYRSGAYMYVATGLDRRAYNGYITVRYTKTTD